MNNLGIKLFSISATGRYCLVTLMSSDRTKQICLWMTIEIYILPYPRGVEFSGEEIIVLSLASIANLSVDELRSRQPFERMYVNNSNCDS